MTAVSLMLPVVHRLHTCCRYYRALSSIETRFPISKDAGHVYVSFLWYDAFRPTKKSEQVSLHLCGHRFTSALDQELLA